MAWQIRRGTEAERLTMSAGDPGAGELIYITDTDIIFVGDGSTAGGIEVGTVGTGDAVFNGNVTFDEVIAESGSGAQTVDFTDGNKAKLTQTGAVTLTLTYPGIGNFVLLVVGTAYTLTWPAALKFPGGTAPDVADDCLVGIYYDGTTAWATFSESMS